MGTEPDATEGEHGWEGPSGPSGRWPGRSPWFPLAAALAIAGVVTWLFAGGGLQRVAEESGLGRPSRQAVVGSLAPALSLSSASGQTVSLQSLHGRPVIINFWATWCLPCRSEMPLLEAAHQAHGPRGLTVLGVNMGESEEEVVAFQGELGLTFLLLVDPDMRAAVEYGVRGLPTTFFVGRDGRIAHVNHGAFSQQTLEAQLQRLLAS